MSSQLSVSIGQYSDRGRKELNQDFHGACIPVDSSLALKGVALGLADGISSSDVSQVASETAIKSFLQDYYCTSEAWSVKRSVYRVLSATNSWLYAQSWKSDHRYDMNRGYVCTLSAMVIKSNLAHLFHIGDARVYRLDDTGLEQLTNDHRQWVSEDKSYLSRALGIDSQCDMDYRKITLNRGDIFVFATDGVYEFVDARVMSDAIAQHPEDLDTAARTIVQQAYERGSDDNLTVQICRIDDLPEKQASEVQQQVDELPLPPILEARTEFDGYRILREIHASSRSHVYLAKDEASASQVIIKAPSIELGGAPVYLERFLTEEWVARRINSGNVLKASMQDRKRNYLYTVFEYIEGQTLAQWTRDNPQPDMELVRGIIEQVAAGLRAFHRLEMLHQDLRPENIIIDGCGVAKIIDFGSVRVAGLVEKAPEQDEATLLGTALYTAPEHYLGESGSTRSEQFSLGVLTYYMLSGKFPYGTKVAQSKSLNAQRRLAYRSVLEHKRDCPVWVDEAIRKAVQTSAHKRYEDISEFTYDLRHPNKSFLNKARPPLIERNPVGFWQGVSFLMTVIVVCLLVWE